MRARRCASALIALAAATLPSARASAEPREAGHVYVIAVGYNGVPDGESSLQALRFADDDAIAFFVFASPVARRSHLLTVVDADTQRRLVADVPETRSPSLAELDAAVADVHEAVEEDARARTPSTVYVYYSGHGTATEGREPSLALVDGALTRQVLYERVLEPLRSARVHLFIDACHAEAVVRPRDADAQVVPTSEDDRTRYALTNTLARFPNVGAVVGATRNAQSHEWESYLGGVFTHELLSGLRGAADVNGDDRVEYSELAAFLSSANGSVRDPRARLEPVIHTPSADPRTAIVDLQMWSRAAVLRSSGRGVGTIFVENNRGDRIADVRPEAGHPVHLTLPAGQTLFIHTDDGEASVRPTAGARIALESLAFARAPTGARGALESSLHEGLFATPFGPSYYRGFVDQGSDWAQVPLSTPEPSSADAAVHRPSAGRVLGWTSIGAAGALAIGAGAFGWMALQAKSDYDRTSIERDASDAASRYTRDTTVGATLGAAAVVSAALGLYLVLRSEDTRSVHGAGMNARGATIEF